MVNTQYLRTFSVLADTKSFVATAKKLHMTQPGVSQHLKHLEEFYDVLLAERKGKFFQLTEAGRKLKKYSDDLFHHHENFKRSIGQDEPTAGRCDIACPGSFGLLLYSFFLDLNKIYPQLCFHFNAAPNASVIQGVREEKYPMGFISTNSADPALTVKQIAREELLLVAPKKSIIKSFDDLVAVGFVAHPDGYHYATRLLSENFPSVFTDIESIPCKTSINQLNRILDAVAAGLGFTVLPEFAVHAYPRQKDIQVVKLKKSVVDPVLVVTKKNAVLPQRYHLVLTQLQSHLKETY